MGMKKVFRSHINGTVYAPSSKSVMQRAVALAMLTKGRSIIKNPSYSDDGLAAITLVNQLGVIKEISDKTLVLESNGIIKNDEDFELSSGESGLCMRMFSPILSLFKNKFVLNGEGSLNERTVEMIERDLNRLGARCKSKGGYPPLEIQGPIKGGEITIDGSVSSQFLSGLLIALPLCNEDSLLRVENLKSRPYVDLTLKMIDDAGVIIEEEKNVFRIKGRQKYKPIEVIVEGDWSGASFLLTAGALRGQVNVRNLQLSSLQADKAILEVLKLAGAEIETDADMISIKKRSLDPFEFDISESPDLFPPIAALAAFCTGKSIIHGTERLKYKESSRGEVIKKEFKLLGIRTEIFDDRIEIYGSFVEGGEVSANNDHRISMALALMGICSENGVKINGWEAITKSYKNFFEDLQEVGGRVE